MKLLDDAWEPHLRMEPHSRLTAEGACLLLVDLQERLLPAIEGRYRLLANAVRLVKGAQILGIPVLATEQYPKGLGPTVESLAALVPDRPAKMTFSSLGAPGISQALMQLSIRHVTLAGVEAHVCVAQTALELLTLGYAVQVPADAVGSRFAVDRDVSLRRLERAGAVISTTEAVLFEWLGAADHPGFKAISALVKERVGE